jgi:hypothetical protein
MNIELKGHQVRLLRLYAQHLLSGRAETPLEPAQLLQEIFALQAQDYPAALLSLWARHNSLRSAAIRNALYQERTIVRVWTLRGTLHLVTREDAAWLLPLLGPRFIQSDRRRFTQLGWDEERYTRALHLLVGALQDRGPLLRAQITDLLRSNDLPSQGQAPVHFLYRAALEGVICEGPEINGKPAFTLFEDWIGNPHRMDRQDALKELVLRYLDGHGPASAEDFTNWSGLKTSDIREVWRSVGEQAAEVDVDGKPALVPQKLLSSLDKLQGKSPGVRLLPRFDTLMLSYADRKWIVDAAYDKSIRPGGGMISATVLVDGKIQGTWSTQRRKGILEVLIQFFQDQPSRVKEELKAQVSSLGRFLQAETAAKMIKSA